MVNTRSIAPPIIFIHGWKASILADKNTGKDEFDYTLGVCLGVTKDPQLELPMEWDDTYNNGHQVKDNLIATEPCHSATACCKLVKLGDIYGPVLDHLEKTRTLHTFAYDWRRCLDETAVEFERFIANVTEESLGTKPQIVAHSMGCLITLSILNRRPDIFHSILFGAGALSPNASVLSDLSLRGYKNKLVLNTTMVTPKVNLTNPSAYFMLAYPGERDLYNKPNRIQFRDEKNDPVELDLHMARTWKERKLGVYHPNSGVENVTAKMEEWLQTVLDKVHKFRKGLLPENSGLKKEDCPPICVLRGDHSDTEFGFFVRSNATAGNGVVDLTEGITHVRGDGRVALEDAVPPSDIPVLRIVTNDREHSQVLNDVENVTMLLDLMLSKKM